ncbi:MAG: hypothetical protein O9302_09340 [Cyclobacteriaceae bacterium]|jgi:hypothetical protein|nr:hypothetical protein [Cytophagales bacterium]MCZ8328248.1 hypothetical protein [Cyclobacteriaceae bacterium]
MNVRINKIRTAISESLEQISATEYVELNVNELFILNFIYYNFYDRFNKYIRPLGFIEKTIAPDDQFFYESLYSMQAKVQFCLSGNINCIFISQAIKKYPGDLYQSINRLQSLSTTSVEYIALITDLIQFLPWQIAAEEMEYDKNEDPFNTVKNQLIFNDVLHFFKNRISKHLEGPAIIDYTTHVYIKNLVNQFSVGEIFSLIDINIEKSYIVLKRNFNPYGNLGRACIEEIEQELKRNKLLNKKIKSMVKRPIELPKPILQDYFVTIYSKQSSDPFHFGEIKNFDIK